MLAFFWHIPRWVDIGPPILLLLIVYLAAFVDTYLD
jgi:hypothetical protein